MSGGEIGAILRQLSANLPRPSGGPVGGRVEIADVLLGLAGRWPAPPTNAERENLDVLCRKVAVAGKVWTHYGEGWKRATDAEPCSHGALLLLAALFIAAASPDKEGETERAHALKYLNAGFSTLDLVRDGTQREALTALEQVADRVLAQLTGH